MLIKDGKVILIVSRKSIKCRNGSGVHSLPSGRKRRVAFAADRLSGVHGCCGCSEVRDVFAMTLTGR